jgi:hypothetical protein
MHIKKSSPYAILNSFADDLKLLPIGPRTEVVGPGSDHNMYLDTNELLQSNPRFHRLQL